MCVTIFFIVHDSYLHTIYLHEPDRFHCVSFFHLVVSPNVSLTFLSLLFYHQIFIIIFVLHFTVFVPGNFYYYIICLFGESNEGRPTYRRINCLNKIVVTYLFTVFFFVVSLHLSVFSFCFIIYV